MIYVDNPLGVGFSYVNLANGTRHTLDDSFEAATDNATGKSITNVDELPVVNLTNIPATMHVFDDTTSTNSTVAAAKTFWNFAQVWFNEFPERRTTNDEISLWGVSVSLTTITYLSILI